MRFLDVSLTALSLDLLMLSAPVRAAEVDWHAPTTCPDAAEVRFRVERAIGAPLAHAAPLRFEVTAEATRGGYVAHLGVGASPDAERSGAQRQRELTAADCTRLADMVTVAISLALADPGAQGDGDLPPNATPPAAGDARLLAAASDTAAIEASVATPLVTNESSSPASVDVGDAVPSAASAAPWRPGVSLWLLGDAGSLPSWGTGVALGVHLQRSYFELRALGTLLFEQHTSVATTTRPAPGADIGLTTGALSACAAPFGGATSGGSSFAAHACAGWELGRLAGEGTGVLRPRHGASVWNAPRLDVDATWTLGSSGLELATLLTVALPLVREDFALEDFGSVHRPAAAVVRAGLGLSYAPE